METRISSLMTVPVMTVRADDTMAAVADVLQRNGLSFVPVLEGVRGPLLGIISASDILHFQAAGRELKAVQAWQVCAYKPLAVQDDTPAIDVARLMMERQVHHVVVMKNQELAGVVSSLDFVRQYIAQVEARQAEPR
ncbi:MAG: CBS domain-containing protein [Noviherbaspirillum sp.]